MAIALLSLVPWDQAIESGFGNRWDHFMAYTVLAAFAGFAGFGSMTAWRIIIAATCYGALLETLQFFVPGRFSEWQDLVADTLGAALGAILAALYRKYFPISDARHPGEKP